MADEETWDSFVREHYEDKFRELEKTDAALHDILEKMRDRQDEELKQIRTRHFRELANPASDENITERHAQEYDDARAEHDEEIKRTIADYQASKLDENHVEGHLLRGEPTMASGAAFDAKIPFAQDPEFIERERSLLLQHERERNKLLEQQDRDRIEFARRQDPTRDMIDEQNKLQREELQKLDDKHMNEHDSYIREYHDAKVIEAELNKQYDEQLKRDMDGPKISR